MDELELHDVAEEQPAEEHRTRAWRFRQLTDLGFDIVRAAVMAEDVGVDLAQARRLVALGCPLETATRILL